MDIPPVQVVGRSDRAKSTRSGRSRPFLSYQLRLNSYIPPQGQAPLMEEVSAPGPEGACNAPKLPYNFYNNFYYIFRV